MGLIDSHAHLTDPGLYGQVEAVLQRCVQSGVERVITIGTDAADAGRAIGLAERFPDQISASVGFHPHEADNVSADDIARMGEHLEHPAVVALGEIGLDYHYDLADRSRQREIFGRQLRLAADRDLPLVIHCREAFEDAVPILLDHGMRDSRVVFHCFTGTMAEAERLAAYGWWISFTGVVTFRTSTPLQAIARRYPSNKLVVETDSPYLSPVPVRGRRPNEPANVVHIARFLADLREIPFETLVEQTTRNTVDFFRLPPRKNQHSSTPPPF